MRGRGPGFQHKSTSADLLYKDKKSKLMSLFAVTYHAKENFNKKFY